MNQRINYIDIAKGICLVAIVMGHTGMWHPQCLGIVKVPLFFFVSGFFFEASARKCNIQGSGFSNWGGVYITKNQ